MNVIVPITGVASPSTTVAVDPPAGKMGPVTDFLIATFDRLGEWSDRAATRHNLGRLEDRMLRDIGLDRGTAMAEAGKPFWRT